MSVLVDFEIEREALSGGITLDPFNPHSLGTNSYDLHLGGTIGYYEGTSLPWRRRHPITQRFLHSIEPAETVPSIIDPHGRPSFKLMEIPEEGIVLWPGVFVLAHTLEIAGSRTYLPCIEGKSSIARMGLEVHSAGFGDIGFAAQWTLELQPSLPIIVYAGMPICQIYFLTAARPRIPYNEKSNSHYANQQGPTPYSSIKDFRKL